MNSFFNLYILVIFFLSNINIISSFGTFDNYPLTYRLNNSNYLVITDKGIYLYDSSLIIKKRIINFNSSQFQFSDSVNQTNIAQFLDEDDGYIICLINNKTYFISEEGKFLTEYSLDYIEERASYPIIPYTHKNYNYYYTIILIDSYNFIFRNYLYNSLSNSISFIGSSYYKIGFYPYKYFTCELMKNNNNNKYITCFYGDWSKNYFRVFNPGNFSYVPLFGGQIDNIGGQFYVSSIKTNGRYKTAFCAMHEHDLICYGYNINTNNFTGPIVVTNNGCNGQLININVKYIPEREEFVFICMGVNYEFYLKRLSIGGEVENLISPYYLINRTICKDLGRFNLFYSSNLEKYAIFTDNNCQNIFYFDSINVTTIYSYPSSFFFCDNYTNYNKTECIDYIPNGFYCNDTIHKTLDKCHDNCETCSHGPTSHNNNCDTCKSPLIFNNGNCSILSCSIKCKNCSIQSNKNDSCISCNNKEGYYPKINELFNNIFIKCYKNPDSYYLLNGYYYPCYSTCKKCFGSGNYFNNNCTECISNYEFKTDSIFKNNCYEKCSYYDYYNNTSNNYHCTNNYVCPFGYTKLIREKKRCIDFCNKDDIFKYEYENICYSNITISEILEMNISAIINTTIIETTIPFAPISTIIHTTIVTTIPFAPISTIIHTTIETIIPITTISTIIPITTIATTIHTTTMETTIHTTTIETAIPITTIATTIPDIINITVPLNNEVTNLSLQNISTTILTNISSNISRINSTKQNNTYNKTYIINDIDTNIISNESVSSFITIDPIITQNDNLKKKDFCPKDFPYFKEATNECVKECKIIDLFSNTCTVENPNKEVKQNIINNLQNAIMDNSLEPLLDNKTIERGEDLTFKEKNAVYQITSSNNQKKNEYNNISSIQLGECENILKKEYNIKNDNISILILKIDYYEEGSLVPTILYEMYHPITKQKLDLNYCKDTKISLSIPASLKEDELFKYNSSNEFYTDICSTYTSENGTDVTLKDRQKEFIEKNLSLCETDCDYNGYDNNSKKVICECNAKNNLLLISDIKIDKDKLKKNFIEIKNLVNINIIKCYKKLFTKEGIENNIGSYILLAIIIFYFIAITLFFMIDYFKLYDLIKKIIKYKQKNSQNEIKPTEKSEEGKEKEDINNPNKYYKKRKIKNENEIVQQINKIIKQNIENDSSINYPPKKKIKIKKKSQNFSYLNELNSGRFSDATKSKSKFELNNNDYEISNYNKKDIDIYKNKDKIILFNKEQKINIYLNDDKISNKELELLNYNDYELNTMEYEEAIIHDKRTYSEYYCSLLRTKHLLFFSFCSINDYNSTIIKICLFFFSFALFYTINALFYNDSALHTIYEQKGKYNFIYQLPKIIYSTIISLVINTIIKMLSLSYKDIIQLKKEKNITNFAMKEREEIKCLTFRTIWFFNISFIFLCFFWYYISCFCVIYRNTQYHLFKDTLISFCLSMIYPLVIYFFPGILRIPSLRNKDEKCKYNISKILQLF